MSAPGSFATSKRLEDLALIQDSPKMQDISGFIVKSRARLTEASVLEIFKSKGNGLSASKIGVRYGINEKTVRDIWTGRTWLKETARLDPSGSIRLQKLGRPIGSRDIKQLKKPSNPKQNSASEMNPSDRDLSSSVKAISLDAARLRLSIDAQIHEWNLQGRWVESKEPSFALFLERYLCLDL